MNKYRKLMTNTLVFSIGTFSSKILVFLMVPLYSNILTTDEYGTADLLTQTANLLIPLISLGIADAVIRFGLDKNENKKDVFTCGVAAIGIGFLLFLISFPLLAMVKLINSHLLLLYAYVFVGAFRLLCTRFVRARQYVKLYSLDGVLTTITLILFNLLFLLGFQWGLNGYVLAIICSDACSVLFLTAMAQLYRCVNFSHMRMKTFRAMLRYSLPMIPANVFWWITHVSDRYAVGYLMGESFNGLYGVAYKIPTILSIVSTIFVEAWQLSAVTEKDSPQQARFFTEVMHSYQGAIFLCASGLVAFSKLGIQLLTVGKAEYADCWQYVPILLMATCFSCFASFLGSVYVVVKKSNMALATTALGAGANVVMNLIFIPLIGVNGAALATFLSYLLVYLVRGINARQYLRFHLGLGRTLIALLLLSAQSLLMIFPPPMWALWQGICLVLMFLFQLKPVCRTILHMLHR